MPRLSSWFSAAAALFLLVQASACGVLDDLSAAVEAQAATYRELAVQMEAPMVVLSEAYPQHQPQVTVHLQDGRRTFEVRLTLTGTADAPSAEAHDALADEAMGLALAAMPNRTTFDEAAFVLTVDRSVAAGPFAPLRPPARAPSAPCTRGRTGSRWSSPPSLETRRPSPTPSPFVAKAVGGAGQPCTTRPNSRIQIVSSWVSAPLARPSRFSSSWGRLLGPPRTACTWRFDKQKR